VRRTNLRISVAGSAVSLPLSPAGESGGACAVRPPPLSGQAGEEAGFDAGDVSAGPVGRVEHGGRVSTELGEAEVVAVEEDRAVLGVGGRRSELDEGATS
jgi:hypothetical protein